MSRICKETPLLLMSRWSRWLELSPSPVSLVSEMLSNDALHVRTFFRECVQTLQRTRNNNLECGRSKKERNKLQAKIIIHLPFAALSKVSCDIATWRFTTEITFYRVGCNLACWNFDYNWEVGAGGGGRHVCSSVIDWHPEQLAIKSLKMAWSFYAEK